LRKASSWPPRHTRSSRRAATQARNQNRASGSRSCHHGTATWVLAREITDKCVTLVDIVNHNSS
jgi:hypothetical protein